MTERGTGDSAAGRVLIIEDDAAVTAVLKAMLQLDGVASISVESGEEALSLIESDRDFDLLLIDDGLPGRHGPETLVEIRRRGVTAPAFLCTGRAASMDTSTASEDVQFKGILAKPFTLQNLRDTVIRSLSQGLT